MKNKILTYNMNIFECTDIRKIIFSYIYPVIITKGMTLKVIDSKFHKYMIGNTYEIFKITRMGKHTVVVIEKKLYKIKILKMICLILIKIYPQY